MVAFSATLTTPAERGLNVLQRTSRTAEDPWLAAAEIALATHAGRKPQMVKNARSMEQAGGWSPIHLSELRGALGTLELHAGRSKQAKRLFVHSLDEATDNSIAQVEWASRKHVGIDLSEAMLSMPLAHEARTLAYEETGHWREAADNAEQWLNDQPFDASPAITGSYVAATGLLDFERAVRIADRGLKANPHSATLLNNKAFALIELGQLPQALEVIHDFPDSSDDKQGQIVQAATRGLYAFRADLEPLGVQLYELAIERARRAQSHDLEAMARIMFAREQLRAGSQAANGLIDRAAKSARNSRSPAVAQWLDDLVRDAKENVPPADQR